MAKAHATACTGVQTRDWRGPDKLRAVSLTNDYSRFATFDSTTIEGLVFETVLNFAQIVASIAQCSSEHMACIFSLGPCPIYGSFQGLRELFSIPFPKDRTINRKTFDLLRLAWSNCSSDFTPLQATLNTTTTASQLWAQQSSRQAEG